MFWAYINLVIAIIAIRGVLKRCLVSATVVITFFIISLCVFLKVELTGMMSFALGAMLYSLPCIAAFSSPYTPKRALMALCSALLMLLELLAAYLWLIDSYAIVGVFYRPSALALYLLMAIACLWGSDGRLHQRNGGYNSWHKYILGNRKATHMVFKGGEK